MADFMSILTLHLTEISEVCLFDRSAEVARFIAKKVKDKIKCKGFAKIMPEERLETNDRREYLNLLSHGGLIKPLQQLADFVINSFALLDFLQSIIRSTSVKQFCQRALEKYAAKLKFSCKSPQRSPPKSAIRTAINIFNKNKQKQSCNCARKDSVKDFKEGRDKKEYGIRSNIRNFLHKEKLEFTFRVIL